jgi:hypothetical protein
MTHTFIKTTYSRMDSTKTLIRRTDNWAHAQKLANFLGRKGWVLKDMVTTDHAATVRYVGKTFFEEGAGLGAKNGWVFDCNCGDGDSTGYKADIVKIAKRHTLNLTINNKNGTVTK